MQNTISHHKLQSSESESVPFAPFLHPLISVPQAAVELSSPSSYLKLLREELCEEVQDADDAVHQSNRHREVVGLLPRDAEQQVGLVLGAVGTAGAADGQHLGRGRGGMKWVGPRAGTRVRPWCCRRARAADGQHLGEGGGGRGSGPRPGV